MSSLVLSHINPLAFVEMAPAQIPQYQSLHMDDYMLENRPNSWQAFPIRRYEQPWRTDDVITLQVQNNTGQLQVSVIDCQQAVLQTFLMTQKQQNVYEPSYYIYESNTALNIFPEGTYWMVIPLGLSKVLISEPFSLKEDQPSTLLIEYTHRKFYQNLIFETGITPSIRVHGFLRKKPTASKDTLYEDQVLDMVMVKSVPYRIWELLFGTYGGVPDWLEDKLGRIFGCSSLRIDGRYYTKNEGAKIEEMDSYGNGILYSYKIELRESINRSGKIFDTDFDTNEELTIVLNSTSKGFADVSENASSSVVQFEDIE